MREIGTELGVDPTSLLEEHPQSAPDGITGFLQAAPRGSETQLVVEALGHGPNAAFDRASVAPTSR